MQAKRPGYSEGTAPHTRRLTTAGRRAAQKRSAATSFNVKAHNRVRPGQRDGTGQMGCRHRWLEGGAPAGAINKEQRDFHTEDEITESCRTGRHGICGEKISPPLPHRGDRAEHQKLSNHPQRSPQPGLRRTAAKRGTNSPGEEASVQRSDNEHGHSFPGNIHSGFLFCTCASIAPAAIVSAHSSCRTTFATTPGLSRNSSGTINRLLPSSINSPIFFRCFAEMRSAPVTLKKIFLLL